MYAEDDIFKKRAALSCGPEFELVVLTSGPSSISERQPENTQVALWRLH